MLKKILNHLLIALVFFVLTFGQEYLFYGIKNLSINWFSVGKYFGILGYFFLVSFIRPNWLRNFGLSFFLILNLFQMAHLSFFGTKILPAALYLFFTQYSEIQGTLIHEVHHVIIPLILLIIPLTLGFYFIRGKTSFKGSRILGVIFILYLIYNPARTYLTNNMWGRQPSNDELGGMNVYLSTSYFLGKILPSKILNNKRDAASNTSTRLSFISKDKPNWDKIIFILGESLTPSHMQIFGYAKNTTPYLNSIKDRPNFVYKYALSAGVSTDIAVSLLVNLGFGDSGILKMNSGGHCFFKLAKDQGYKTFFNSIQSHDQIKYMAPYLCPASLDEFKTLEDLYITTSDYQTSHDRDLLVHLQKKLNQKSKQFIMIHQRGSHPPWELRFSAESKIFPGDDNISHYDNSVVEFDTFMKELDQKLLNQKEKVLVFYVSDHGQLLGDDGRWGHGMIHPGTFEVPFLMLSYNAPLPEYAFRLPKFLSHYNIGLVLAKELGYTANQNLEEYAPDYMIYGNDLDGFNGKATIQYNPDQTYKYQIHD